MSPISNASPAFMFLSGLIFIVFACVLGFGVFGYAAVGFIVGVCLSFGLMLIFTALLNKIEEFVSLY